MYSYDPFVISIGIILIVCGIVGFAYLLSQTYIYLCQNRKTKITYRIEHPDGIFGSFYIETMEGPKEVYFPAPQGRIPNLSSFKEDIVVYVTLPFTAKLYPFIDGKSCLKPKYPETTLSILLNDHVTRTEKHGIQLLVMDNKNYIMRDTAPMGK